MTVEKDRDTGYKILKKMEELENENERLKEELQKKNKIIKKLQGRTDNKEDGSTTVRIHKYTLNEIEHIIELVNSLDNEAKREIIMHDLNISNMSKITYGQVVSVAVNAFKNDLEAEIHNLNRIMSNVNKPYLDIYARSLEFDLCEVSESSKNPPLYNFSFMDIRNSDIIIAIVDARMSFTVNRENTEYGTLPPIEISPQNISDESRRIIEYKLYKCAMLGFEKVDEIITSCNFSTDVGSLSMKDKRKIVEMFGEIVTGKLYGLLGTLTYEELEHLIALIKVNMRIMKQLETKMDHPIDTNKDDENSNQPNHNEPNKEEEVENEIEDEDEDEMEM